LTGSLLIAIAWASPAPAGSIFRYTNTQGSSRFLSDLTVYGEGNNKKVILEEDPSTEPDVEVKPGQPYKSPDVGFEIKKVDISIKLTRGGTETKTVGANFVQQRIQQVAWLSDPSLILALTFPVAAEPPPAGTLLSFTDGLNPNLPGWFVGTILDRDTGTVSGPFTGTAEISATGEVMTIPEPNSFTLAGVGALVLFVFCGPRREPIPRSSLQVIIDPTASQLADGRVPGTPYATPTGNKGCNGHTSGSCSLGHRALSSPSQPLR